MTQPVTMVADDRTDDRPMASFPQLACPVCQKALPRSGFGPKLSCSGCGFVMEEANGIFRALPPEREQYFRQFVREYELVRATEGRGSSSSDFYLALPYKDLTGRNSWQWQIRARTFRCLERQILPVVERTYHSGCDVLDIGAGNGWFSYRMAWRGHRPIAVDLQENDSDGLGAAKHFFPQLRAPFPRFLAEMDRLPFAPAQFDVVVFNASLHYSADYVRTLREAIRCLRRPGFVIITDSPFYSSEESGQAMLTEKHADFKRRFGFSSDSIPSLEYLTPASLKRLAEAFSLDWQVATPWYGLNWAMRPWKARLLRRREPSQFHVFWTQVHG